MRFLHTSDWHLGRQFHNLSLLDDQHYILSQLVDLARDEAVQAIVVAGDIYDRSVPPADAVFLLDDVVHRVQAELGIPLIMIAGNHDSAKRVAFGARQLAAAGVHIAGLLPLDIEPVMLSDAHGPVAVYAMPYLEPISVGNTLELEISSHEQAVAAVLDRIHAARPSGQRSVLVSHSFVAGGQTSESERPLSVGGADQVPAAVFEGFDYVALGHLHGPQHRGRTSVRYSGSILKYSFSEVDHDKGVSIVDMDASGNCEIRHVPLTPRRDVRIVEGFLDDLLAAGVEDPARDDYLLVRLSDAHALLDVMGKLRTVYPNVLHLERPGLIREGDAQARADRMRKGELAMFEDFWAAVGPGPLSDDAQSYVSTMIDQIHRGEAG